MNIFRILLHALALVGWLCATPAQAAETVAEVNGKPITRDELEAAAKPHLAELEQQRQQILEGVLAELVEVKLIEAEAAKRSVSVDELVRAEVVAKVPPVTEAEVARIYEENKARVGGKSLEELRGQIQQYLVDTHQREAREAFVAGLRKNYTVRMRMEVQRANVEVADAPVRGGAGAPVTIIAWSDFQCPFCSRVVPTFKQLEEKYGDKLRIAFRQYPASFHPQAQKAAEASLCAREQSRFWEMHDALFANQSQLGVDQLKVTATRLGLDAAQFNQCLDSGKAAAQVKKDFEAGNVAGVAQIGTPAIFVNGRVLRGAVPFEEMVAMIDDELSRKGM